MRTDGIPPKPLKLVCSVPLIGIIALAAFPNCRVDQQVEEPVQFAQTVGNGLRPEGMRYLRPFPACMRPLCKYFGAATKGVLRPVELVGHKSLGRLMRLAAVFCGH